MSEYLGLIIVPIMVSVYIIVQILWTIRARRRKTKQRQLAEGAIKTLAKKTLDPPFAIAAHDTVIEELEKEYKRIENL